MKFREWTITINGKGPINVVANEDTLLILQEYQHVEVALKIDNETVQVKSLGYNEDFSSLVLIIYIFKIYYM